MGPSDQTNHNSASTNAVRNNTSLSAMAGDDALAPFIVAPAAAHIQGYPALYIPPPPPLVKQVLPQPMVLQGEIAATPQGAVQHVMTPIASARPLPAVAAEVQNVTAAGEEISAVSIRVRKVKGQEKGQEMGRGQSTSSTASVSTSAASSVTRTIGLCMFECYVGMCEGGRTRACVCVEYVCVCVCVCVCACVCVSRALCCVARTMGLCECVLCVCVRILCCSVRCSVFSVL